MDMSIREFIVMLVIAHAITLSNGLYIFYAIIVRFPATLKDMQQTLIMVKPKEFDGSIDVASE